MNDGLTLPGVPVQDGAPPKIERTTRPRVLLVDDEPSLGRAIASALEDEHDVTSLTSGEAAIGLLAGDRGFDVILCDLMMPGITGIDVWKRVSESSPELGARFIFMSGGAFTPEATAFLDAGHPCLEKPFDLHELRALLRARTEGA